MNILMLNYEYPPLGSGAGLVTKSLSEELVCLGHNVDVLTMGYRGLPIEENINGVQIFRVPSIRTKIEMCSFHEMLSYCISASHLLPVLLRWKKYDINHTHFIIPTGVISCLYSNKIPYIITTHGSDVFGHNPNRFQLQHIAFKPFSKIILKKASYITSPSIYMKQEIIKHFGKRKIAVIPHGITSCSFYPLKKERKILTVSRLLEMKGIQYVIEAMTKIEGYVYVICGEGSYRPQLENQIKRLHLEHKVMLRGHLDKGQLKQEYESAAIFVLPSIAESFGLVLLEAMMAECAVITTNTTGCVEVVGDTALLVPSKDPKSIKNHLITLINDPDLCQNLGKRGRKRAEDEFTWDTIAQRYINLYKEVLLQ